MPLFTKGLINRQLLVLKAAFVELCSFRQRKSQRKSFVSILASVRLPSDSRHRRVFHNVAGINGF